MKMRSFASQSRTSGAAVQKVLGRPDPVVLTDSGGRIYENGSLTVMTEDATDRQAIDAIMDTNASLLLQFPPDHDEPDRWIAHTDHERTRLIDQYWGHRRDEAIAWQQVARPPEPTTPPILTPAEPPPPPPEEEIPLREADENMSVLYASGGDYDHYGTSGTGATVTAVTGGAGGAPAAYSGTQILRHHAGPTVSAGDPIARASWFAPAGATIETNNIFSAGDECWIGGAFYFRDADTHDFTAFLRIGDNNNAASGNTSSIIQLVFESSTNVVRMTLEDYQGTSANPGTVTYYSGVAGPVDQWCYWEIGFLMSDSTSTGWAELWKNDVQHSTRVTNRTIKQANHVYRRSQLGLGNYHANAAGREAYVYTDDTYIANFRRGPS